MSAADLQTQLAALRAKRRPPPTEAELHAKAEEDALRMAIEAEQRALRADENEAIIAQHAASKTRRFFDFDPDGEQPATVEHSGATCALYTRFVVRGANADQLEKHSDAITAKQGPAGIEVMIDTAKVNAVVNECARACVVYPTAKLLGITDEQHAKNVAASLWHLGAARAEVGKAAIELGGVDAAAHRSKS